MKRRNLLPSLEHDHQLYLGTRSWSQKSRKTSPSTSPSSSEEESSLISSKRNKTKFRGKVKGLPIVEKIDSNNDDRQCASFDSIEFLRNCGISLLPQLLHVSPSVENNDNKRAAKCDTNPRGCVINLSKLQIDSSSSTPITSDMVQELLLAKMKSTLTGNDNHSFVTSQLKSEDANLELLIDEEDDIEWIMDSISKSKKLKEHECHPHLLQDLHWWANEKLRHFTLLRRMLLPMYYHMDGNSTDMHLLEERTSFIAVLLRINDLQPRLISGLLQKLHQMQRVREKCHRNELSSSSLQVEPKDPSAIPSSSSCEINTHDAIGNIIKLIQDHIIPLVNGRNIITGSPYPTTFTDTSDNHDEEDDIQNPLSELKAKSIPWVEASSDQLSIRQAREILLKKAKACRRKRESLMVNSNTISFSNFLRKTAFMDEVNNIFQKRFTPGRCRPPLAGITFSKEVMEQLHSTFFDAEDGSLRSGVLEDVDVTPPLDPRYITFGKYTLKGKREDKRFQIFLKKHADGPVIKTRKKIEQIFENGGVVSSPLEYLHDIGLLFGGTEDQRLHFDVGRQIMTWHEKKSSSQRGSPSNTPTSSAATKRTEGEPILYSGWEVDRIRYNKAMESRYCPASILVGFGSKDVLLGVQKDHIQRDKYNKYCKIIGGTGQFFKIARENKHLVVISIPIGCIFAGDFPHCGVRNFPVGTPEDNRMNELNERISQIVEEHQKSAHAIRAKAIVDMLCNFPGLDRICRLHCSTKMSSGKKAASICIPSDTVGFSDCWMNERDGRCFDSDET